MGGDTERAVKLSATPRLSGIILRYKGVVLGLSAAVSLPELSTTHVSKYTNGITAARLHAPDP